MCQRGAGLSENLTEHQKKPSVVRPAAAYLFLRDRKIDMIISGGANIYPAGIESALLAHCTGRLAGYKRPRSIDFITEMPRDPNGKLYKRRLRQPYWEERPRARCDRPASGTSPAGAAPGCLTGRSGGPEDRLP